MAEETPKEKVAPKKKRKSRKRRIKRPDLTAAMRALWADPERRASLLANRREIVKRERELDPEKFKRVGIPNGMTRESAQRKWNKHAKSAKKTVEAMEKNGVFKDDDSASKEAMEFNITVMRGGYAIRERLAAASKILEYTKTKPVAKSEVTVNKAEEWLAAVSATENDGESNQSDDTEDA